MKTSDSHLNWAFVIFFETVAGKKMKHTIDIIML